VSSSTFGSEAVFMVTAEHTAAANNSKIQNLASICEIAKIACMMAKKIASMTAKFFV
jgi:hypothetical protein